VDPHPHARPALAQLPAEQLADADLTRPFRRILEADHPEGAEVRGIVHCPAAQLEQPEPRRVEGQRRLRLAYDQVRPEAAKVKVISYDRLALNSDVDLYVTFDRNEIGTMQAQYLVERAPKGNYVLIGGSPGDEGARVIHSSQMKVLQPYVDRGDVKVVADGYIQDWVASEAYVFMLKAIETAHGNVAGVIAANDALAGGAIQALREHGLAGKTLVSGQDADLASVICIAEGAQSMTVYKPVTEQAERTAEEAVRLAKGEKIETTRTVNNKKVDVPTIMLKPILVTRGNIKETVVKDGFQTLTSINRDLPEGEKIH
jgi:D-xylose transport system substrate-binding protein